MKSETRKVVSSLFLFLAILGPLKTATGYLFSPVNCVAKTGVAVGNTVARVIPEVVSELRDGALCIYGNVTGHPIA